LADSLDVVRTLDVLRINTSLLATMGHIRIAHSLVLMMLVMCYQPAGDGRELLSGDGASDADEEYSEYLDSIASIQFRGR